MNYQSQEVIKDIVELFGRNNIRLTPQRIGVYRYLIENRNHPTVDMVYHYLKNDNPSLSKTTIQYRRHFIDSGLYRMIGRQGRGSSRRAMECHGHFICEQCGKIIDFTLDGCRLPDKLKQFQLHNYEVRAFGICPECSE